MLTSTITVNQYILIPIVDINADGTSPDTTEPLSVTSSQAGFASAVVDPANPRQVKVTGLLAGVTVVTIGAPGVPIAAQLTVTVTVNPLPNLSRIDMAPGGILGPYPL